MNQKAFNIGVAMLFGPLVLGVLYCFMKLLWDSPFIALIIVWFVVSWALIVFNDRL